VSIDLGSDPGFGRKEAAARLKLSSGIAFPVIADGDPLGVVDFYAFDRVEPKEGLLRTLAEIGLELGRFLQHRRAELGPPRLSSRELQVLRLAAEGNSGPEIAGQLTVSPATVKTHFEHIYEKLGVSDRAGAVAYALRIGLIH
jgi:DNA-binding CsgD family transcriptional regulator